MAKNHLSFLLLGLATATGCVGEPGEEGEMGAQGETGETGATGATGAAGTACWDLDANNACDLETEDKNNSGTCDVNDCAANGDGYIRNAPSSPTGQNAYFSIESGMPSRISNYNSNSTTLILQGIAYWDSGSGGTDLLEFRSGSPVRTIGNVDSYGGFYMGGKVGLGWIPMHGPGERMMWHPYKAAFRVGGAGGTEWNDPNIGFYSTASGYSTKASGLASVAMGESAVASGDHSTAFGDNTVASGDASFAGGASSTASGDFSVALGHNAVANTQGSFVFADSTNQSISPLAANQFIARASGGFRLYTNAGGTTGVYLSAGGSGWGVISDRNAKTDFQTIDGEDLLARLATVEVSNWVYKEEVGQPRHIGPMAQDFYAAFGLGTEDTRVNSLDLDGVNMAAVQALEIRTRELAHTTREVAELKNEVQSLRADIERLEKLVIAQQQLAGAAR